ncbi:MAG: hypothetical protein HY819_18295 [Acidobacteria bacterium]|nr:hypothetical protein [Acidobacteriota bacterium]
MTTERRKAQAEYRAGKRFLAMFMEKYPIVGRLAYLTKDGDKKVCIKALFTSNILEKEVKEFAKAVGTILAQQEGVEILLVEEDSQTAPEIKTDEQMKSIQLSINNFVQVLCKSNQFKDKEAEIQKKEYLARLKSYYDAQLNYLLS